MSRDRYGDPGVEEYCNHMRIPILMRISLGRAIARSVARGPKLVEALGQCRRWFAAFCSRNVEEPAQ